MAYHSITLGGKNTWDDWRLLPSSRPYVAPPEPRTNYIEIPGMDGALDYTELLGPTKFKQRTGSWEFIVVNEDRDGYRPVNWATRYSVIMNWIQGQKLTVRLEDDPSYNYVGRVRVSGWHSGENYSTITLEYALDPYKYPVNQGTGTLDWRWNDLFNTTIYYGTFDVSGSKARNLLNPTPNTVYPVIECSSAMTVIIRGTTYNLIQGRNTNIALYPGDNNATFTGTGRVMVDYKIGVAL